MIFRSPHPDVSIQPGEVWIRGPQVMKGYLTIVDRLKELIKVKGYQDKRVRHVGFIDVIPKSASGKILRRVLVERERSTESP